MLLDYHLVFCGAALTLFKPQLEELSYRVLLCLGYRVSEISFDLEAMVLSILAIIEPRLELFLVCKQQRYATCVDSGDKLSQQNMLRTLLMISKIQPVTRRACALKLSVYMDRAVANA